MAAFYCIPQSGSCLFCSGEVVVGLALLFRAAFYETGLFLVAAASYFTPLFGSSLFGLSDFVAVVTSPSIAVVTGFGLFLAAAIASKPRKRSKAWMRQMQRSSKPGARSKAWMRRMRRSRRHSNKEIHRCRVTSAPGRAGSRARRKAWMRRTRRSRRHSNGSVVAAALSRVPLKRVPTA